VLFIWGVFETRFKEEGFPRFKGSDWFARVLYITKSVWLYLSLTQNDYHRVVKTLQLKFANSYNTYIYTHIYIDIDEIPIYKPSFSSVIFQPRLMTPEGKPQKKWTADGEPFWDIPPTRESIGNMSSVQKPGWLMMIKVPSGKLT